MTESPFTVLLTLIDAHWQRIKVEHTLSMPDHAQRCLLAAAGALHNAHCGQEEREEELLADAVEQARSGYQTICAALYKLQTFHPELKTAEHYCDDLNAFLALESKSPDHDLVRAKARLLRKKREQLHQLERDWTEIRTRLRSVYIRALSMQTGKVLTDISKDTGFKWRP